MKVKPTNEKLLLRGKEYNVLLDERGKFIKMGSTQYNIIEQAGDISQLEIPLTNIFDEITYKCIDKCIFKCDITSFYRENDQLDNICIRDSYFIQSLDLDIDTNITDEHNIYIRHLRFYNVRFEKNCLITWHPHQTNIFSTVFIQCHFENKLRIRNNENNDYDKDQKNKTKLNKLHIIDCTASSDAYLRIGFLNIVDFKLSNLRNPPNTELNIGDCCFHSFELVNFRNLGKFKLYKINALKDTGAGETQEKTVFNINNTSIGDTDFQGLDLSSFDAIKLFDNILSGINYTNVKWGNPNIKVGQFGKAVQLTEWNDISLAKYLYNDYQVNKRKITKKQDTYRTLKNLAQRNNDIPQALNFYAKEMQCYQKIVSGNSDYSKSDKVTLWFNKVTNNFGLSFGRPIIFLFLASFICYFLLLLSLNIDIFIAPHWNSYFEFLSPIHKTQFIGSYWGFYTSAIDLMFRIIEGLLIYQTIQAFRKYSRKL